MPSPWPAADRAFDREKPEYVAPDYRPETRRQEQEHRQPRALPAPLSSSHPRAVTEAVRDRSIKEIENSKSIIIPRKDISEPVFRHGPGGKREMVHPGNEDYIRGDHIPRPDGGRRWWPRRSEQDGEGEDDFVFELTREEFMQYFFEDLELPRLVKTHLLAVPSWKNMRAGYSTDGTPNNIDIVRSLRSSLGRRIALGSPLVEELRRAEELLMER